MTFRMALYNHVKGFSLPAVPDFERRWFYVYAIGEEPHFTMNILGDPGQQKTFCDEQGENGELSLQVSIVAQGAVKADLLAESLYRKWLGIKGLITLNYQGDDYIYQVYRNRTEKPKAIGSLELGNMQVIFESTLEWIKK